MKESVIRLVTRAYPTMSDGEKKIADLLMKEHKILLEGGVNAIANRAGVSNATVSRLAKHLGFASFKQFQFALASSSLDDDHLVGEEKADFDEQLETVLFAETSVLKSTYDTLDKATLSACAKRLHQAEKLLLFGQGTSLTVAQDAAVKFRKMQKTALVPSNLHDASVLISALSKTDVVVLVSHSGETEEVKRLLRLANEEGIFVVGVTTYPQSTLGKNANCALFSVTLETPDHRVSFSSRTSQLFVLDALFLATMYEDKEKNLQKIERARQSVYRTR